MIAQCDKDYEDLIIRFVEIGAEGMLLLAEKCAEQCGRENPGYYKALRSYYSSWYGVNSFSSKDPGFASYFGGIYRFIAINAEGFLELYNRLCDYRSRYSFLMMLQNWLTFAPDLRYHSVEHTFPNYYDLDLFPSAGANEVFVDCGAYDGDSIKSFVKMYGTDYKRVYAYEIVPKIYDKLKENLKEYPNIVFRNVGVSDKNGTASLNVFESASSIMQGGAFSAPVVRLDDDIDEEITFIKMDIEGAEPLALRGAEKHIRSSRPKLAVCLYHSIVHLLEIPFLINELNPEYRLYFRHLHDPKDGGIPFPIEYMVYAV